MSTKVFLLLLGTLLMSYHTTIAQRGIKVGYIDMDYILENVPEYQEASKQLSDKVNRWKLEVETKLGEIDKMKKQLNNERPLLTQELIEERNEEISFEEEQILDYQQNRFGPGGDLSIQKRRLIEPVQDQVFNAVQEISVNKKYDFVMNKSEVLMLYAADRHDISDQVLRSITRSSKRKQINSKKEENAFDRNESKNIDEDQATLARQGELEAKKKIREVALKEKATARAIEKEERQKDFEERRQRLLDERKRKKDSIAATRPVKANTKTAKDSVDKTKQTTDSKAAIIEARQRRKDSILNIRKIRRDSILNARKEKLPVLNKSED